MRTLLDSLKEKAKADPKRVVFPEVYEEKTLRAVEILLKEKIVIPYLIGDRAQIDKKAAEFQVDLSGAEVRDPRFDDNFEKYVEEYIYLRKGKGITPEIARVKMRMPAYFGAMMIHMKHADGMISGLNSETKPFIAAFEIIGAKETFHKVSGLFLMLWPADGRLLLFADSSTIIDPDAKDLAEIAIDTGETAKKFGIEPRIAFLSFSTRGSARHALVDKIVEATKIAKYRRPELVIDGEMQVDAALVPEVAKKKCPDSPIQGDANVLIFPDLNAGNIAYKLVERLAKAHAVGPILQGLKMPVNDLSRGCSVQDIVDVTIITAVEAQGNQ
jgi:phosphate acetyltransferase